MNLAEKIEFISQHLHEVNEPEINTIYHKLRSLIEDSKMIESEQDIAQGKLTSHELLKQEVRRWRPAK